MTTIDDACEALLTERDKRLAERSYRNSLEVVELFRDCSYGYGSELERRRCEECPTPATSASSPTLSGASVS